MTLRNKGQHSKALLLLIAAAVIVMGELDPLGPWLPSLGSEASARTQKAGGVAKHPPKVWVNHFQEQSIEFELTQFPGNVFKIAIPEVVSDAEGPIVPWAHNPDTWEFSRESARWKTTIPDMARVEAEVEFRKGQIETRVKLTNLSTRTWRRTNVFTCLTYADAPLFNDPALERTYVPTGNWTSPGGWVPLGSLFATAGPKSGAYTFFPVLGGPPLDELWLYRVIQKPAHRQVLSKAFGCVVSKDGKWTIGMTTMNPAYFFNNRSKRVEHQDGVCIHADPLLGEVAPGQSAEGISTIYIVEGKLDAFVARCLRLYSP